MSLDDEIRRLREARGESSAAAANSDSEEARQAERANVALTEIGQSAAAILEREGVPMFREMQIMKSRIFGNYTVKLLGGRLWALGGGHGGTATMLSSDGTFYTASIWRRGVTSPAGRFLYFPRGAAYPHDPLYSDYMRRQFEARAERIAKRHSLPGGYSRPQETRARGFSPKDRGEYSVYGLFLTGETLMYGSQSTQEPYATTVARLLEETLA